jgi:hypothetical protein
VTQQSVTKITSLTFGYLVAPTVAAKHELFKKTKGQFDVDEMSSWQNDLAPKWYFG